MRRPRHVTLPETPGRAPSDDSGMASEAEHPSLVRDRVRRMIDDAGLPGAEIERAVYNNAIKRCSFAGVCCSWENCAFGGSYTSCALSVVRNLEAVRAALEEGASEQEVVLKTPRDLRPDIWKDLVDKKRERDAAYSAKPAANTNMYRCKRCQSRECYYFGLQTRSGDEPMTIFISCLNCGNRWRTEG